MKGLFLTGLCCASVTVVSVAEDHFDGPYPIGARPVRRVCAASPSQSYCLSFKVNDRRMRHTLSSPANHTSGERQEDTIPLRGSRFFF